MRNHIRSEQLSSPGGPTNQRTNSKKQRRRRMALAHASCNKINLLLLKLSCIHTEIDPILGKTDHNKFCEQHGVDK